MKRLSAIILMMILAISMVACNNNSAPAGGETTPPVQSEETGAPVESPSEEPSKEDEKPAEETTAPTEKPEEKPAEKPAETPSPAPAPSLDSVPAGSVGASVLKAFKAAANNSASARSVAETLSQNASLPFSPMVESVEPGYLTGFDNAEITGFKSASVFLPMIGTTPFVGYVFELEEGADAAAFISNLKSSANLRWNICTSADEMVTSVVGNKVLFVMCPLSFEQE